MQELDGVDLFKLVLEVDDELIKEKAEPFQRPRLAYLKIAQRLQPGGSRILKHDPLFSDVDKIYSELYRLQDLSMPPMHIGAFRFRDVFFPIRIPIMYGPPSINPADFLTNIPDIPKRWLFSIKENGLSFFDQVIDLMDFSYGLDDLNKTKELPAKTMEWWYLSKQQIEAAAVTALGSFNKYAVIQNCCIATELLLKGALLAKGVDEKTLANTRKGYGHNLGNLANETTHHLSGIDKETMLFAVNKLPEYVKSRYESLSFSRLELGDFLMNTQFISGEILRQFSNRNIRADFSSMPDANWNLTQRTFPSPG